MLQLCNTLFQFKDNKNPNAVYLFIHIVCMALEHEITGEQRRAPGTIKTSISKLSESSTLPPGQTRTALIKLIKSKLVTSSVTNNERIITVENYEQLTKGNCRANKPGDKQKSILTKACVLLERITTDPKYCDQKGKLVVELPLNTGGIRTPKVYYFGGS